MPPESSTLERRDVLYSGRVQGVGFRYTARQLAGDYEVTGYVRNLADGRVQLVVEGSHAEIDRYMNALADQLPGYIRDVAADVRPATGEFAGFDVRH
jgi:acylphosphatase